MANGILGRTDDMKLREIGRKAVEVRVDVAKNVEMTGNDYGDRKTQEVDERVNKIERLMQAL